MDGSVPGASRPGYQLKITKKAKAENSVAVYTAKIHEMVAPAVPDDDEDLYDD